MRYECPRCGGQGGFPEYDHVDGGRCFECGGHGWLGDDEDEDEVD